MQENESLSRFSDLLHKEINEIFKTGTIYAAFMALTSALLMFIIQALNIGHDFLIPGVWAFLCGLYCIFIHFLARRGRITSKNQYVIIFFFVSLPTLIYIISYFVNPSGTATYITGPPSYLYFVTIIITGFLFDRRVSATAGIIAGTEYFIIFLLGWEHLQAIQCNDGIMLQDLTGLPFYFFKSFMMIISGIIVGMLSQNTRRLIADILKEEHEKQTIDRLFGQYVSNEIKDRIIAQKRQVIGEKQSMVILMSDIRSFSTISENLPPEQLVNQLNQYLEKMVGCIEVNGGVVDKFVGDAILATFGGVMELDNPCLSAVSAAEMMMDKLSELNEQWERESLHPFRIGIGIHYGEAIQGSIGSTNRKEFTVIGDPVNTTSRIESLTKEYGYGILISGNVYEMLPDERKKIFNDVGLTDIRGKVNKIHIYGTRRN